MSLNGGWVSYPGDARIELAVGLLAVAGCAACAGVRLRRPVRAVRPPTSVVVLMFSLWVIALIAFMIGISVYVQQFVHDYPHIRPGAHNPVTPVTLLAAAALFGIILTRTGWRYQTRLASGAIGAIAAPMIFELPFDLIVMARTYPPIPPDPALYRALFFVPLFLIEITTLLLLRLSPMVRLTRVYVLFLRADAGRVRGLGPVRIRLPVGPAPYRTEHRVEDPGFRHRPHPVPASAARARAGTPAG